MVKSALAPRSSLPTAWLSRHTHSHSHTHANTKRPDRFPPHLRVEAPSPIQDCILLSSADSQLLEEAEMSQMRKESSGGWGRYARAFFTSRGSQRSRDHLRKPLREHITGGGGGGPCMIYSIKVPLHGGSEIASPPQGSSLSFTPIPLVRETAAGRGLAGSRHCTEWALAAQHATRERHPPSTATKQAWGLSPFYELGN